jgi:hypothetical protein
MAQDGVENAIHIRFTHVGASQEGVGVHACH